VLRARLFGGLHVEIDGVAIESPASTRPWAVFAYLALAPMGVTRTELATRFWPDVLDHSARASLRSALWALRRQLPDRVAVEGERVALVDDDGLWIDAREFERLAEHAPEQALELHRGPLLDGLDDEWVLAARERFRERAIDLMERLAQTRERHGDGRGALELTRRQAECDPLDEEVHRRLITRLSDGGDRAGALRAYRALSQRMARELAVAPSGRTRELIEQLRRQDIPALQTREPEPAPGLLALVGRERELRELEQVWGGVNRGRGATAVIRGEAGIGKTRLAGELRARVAAGGHLTACCGALDLGGSAPLSLWAELVRELLPALAPPPPQASWPQDVALLAVELPAHFAQAGAPTASVAPDLQRTRLFEAVVALLAWAASQRPVLLVLEDIHSADEPSLELAAYAARRAAGLPIMMAMTRRDLPTSAAADRLEHALRSRGLLACELDLQPLAAEPVATLAREAAPLSEPDVARVVANAEGNALLAVETARALGRGHRDVAPSLRGTARAEITPLGGDVRALIEIAAVAARPVDADELEQLEFQDATAAAAEALQTGLLLAREGRIGFRHALLRDAVREEIADPRRRALHKRWAQALLASERAGAIPLPAEVARQLRLAGADAEAVPQLARAAAKARSLAALDQAVAYLREALQIAPQRSDLWLFVAELEAWSGRRERAEEAFERAIELLGDGSPFELARAWLAKARAYHGPICMPRGVLECAGAARALLEQAGDGAEAERREALAALAWAQAVAGSADEAERLLSELDCEAPPGDLHTYDVGHARAFALMRRGRFRDSYEPASDAGEAIARAGRPDLAYGCWANVAAAASAAGDFDCALGFIDRGFDAIAGQGLKSPEIHLHSARAFVLRRMGRMDQARAATECEAKLAAELEQPELVAMAKHDRAMVALESGEDELAARLLGESLIDGVPISRPLTRLALAEALIRTRELDRAAGELRAAVLEPVAPSDFPETLVPRLARVQGLLALAREDLPEGELRLAESVAGWERLLARSLDADSVTAVLADLGRPVVGLVEPARELARVRADLQAAVKGEPIAVVS
jgi:DNA-binding SARP family transcriptional activator